MVALEQVYMTTFLLLPSSGYTIQGSENYTMMSQMGILDRRLLFLSFQISTVPI